MVNYVFIGSYNVFGISNKLNYDPNGANNNTDLFMTVSTALSNELTTLLPEGVNFPTRKPTWLKNTDIHIVNNSTDLKLTFFNEGAGYLNTLGYYIYSDESPVTSVNDIDTIYVIFPNASLSGSGGALRKGDTIAIPSQVTVANVGGKNIGTPTNYDFNAGMNIGFVLFANGWNGDSRTVNFSSRAVYSNPSFNVETIASEKYHTANIQSIVDKNLLVVSFEDQTRSNNQSDNDFNDVCLLLTLSPFNAIDPQSFVVTDPTNSAYVGGDPHVKLLNGKSYTLPNDWKLVNLLTCVNEFKNIEINASCVTLLPETMAKKYTYHKRDSDEIRLVNVNSDQFINGTFFENMYININGEKTIINLLDFRTKNLTSKYLIVNRCEPKVGLMSVHTKRHYPLTNTTKEMNVHIDNININIKIDSKWDETNEISFSINDTSVYQTLKGAIITNSTDNRLE